MTRLQHQAIYTKLIEKFGDKQIVKAIEEMAELTKELCKFQIGDYNKENIMEEIADVEIMINQLKIIFDCEDLVSNYIIKKLSRTEERYFKEG